MLRIRTAGPLAWMLAGTIAASCSTADSPAGSDDTSGGGQKGSSVGSTTGSGASGTPGGGESSSVGSAGGATGSGASGGASTSDGSSANGSTGLSSTAGGSGATGNSATGGGASSGATGDRDAGATSSGGDRDASAGTAGTSGGTSGGTGSEAGAGNDVVATFHNGVFWNDSTNKRIEAHGGGFIRMGDTWYWIGEDKSANSGVFKAVNCYSSKDLAAWKFENAIITKSTTADLATAGRIIERPKVIYNDSTKQFVMWLHWDGNNYAEAKAGVFSSATICGNYAYQSSFQPNGNMSRDDTLFKDDDGKAYFISAANNNKDLGLYELSADYLTVQRQVATLFAGSSREAPAMFKEGGTYYLISSAATGWDPNQAKYATATAIGGPWTALKNIGDSTTYDTQAAYVIPVVGSQATTFVYASDRWQDPDLVSSKYIWLPIKVNGTTLAMDYYDQWQLDLTTGKWSANDGFLSQAGWTLLYADSEETQGEDGHAKNAFDGSASTIWHTQYTGSAPAHPHEIQIDLGATYAVQGFRYTPRQDKDDHGMIADYQFYASQSSTSWGTAVATGTFTSSRTATTVPFARTMARYIRFVALSEINGQPWTSVAELDLVPAP